MRLDTQAKLFYVADGGVNSHSHIHDNSNIQ